MRQRQFNQLASLPSGHVLNACRGPLSIVIPVARTNLITNPSFETNTTNWTASGGSIARSTEQQYHGAYSLKVTPTAGAADGVLYGTVSLTSGVTYAASCKVYGAPGVPYKLSIATTGGVELASYRFVGSGRWQWVWVYWTETSTTTRRMYVTKDAHTSTAAFYIDGAQIEQITAGETVSTYIDGDQQALLEQFPAAYRWNGTRHAATSTRSANTRDGGMVKNLDLFKFYVTALIGLGLTSPSHIVATRPALDGAVYQGAIVPSRAFTVEGRLNTRSDIDRDQRRKALSSALGIDATAPRQQFVLLYQKHDGLRPTGDVGKIVAGYRDGFEGQWDNTVGEDVALQFMQFLPFIRGADEGTTITVSDTIATGANRETFYRNDAGTWSLLDNTVNAVNAIARHPDGSLYLVGDFTSYGGTSANRIIRFNPYTGAFSALGTGLNGTAQAVKIGASGKVYVCGDFTTAGGTTVNRVAVWDPVAATWAALGAGATKGVDAIAYAIDLDSNENLYITGDFLNAGGAGATRIAKWTNATNAWSALGTGLNSQGNGIAVGLDDGVYVHGAFSTANGVSATRIAKWNGTTFEALGSGVSSQPSNNALRVAPSGDVYVGGAFVTAGGLTVNGIARWNGFTWAALGSGVAGASANVSMLEFAPDGLLYVTGSFTQVSGIVTSDAFAAWNGSSWVLPDIDIPGTANAIGMGFTASGGIVIFFDNSDVGNASAAHVNTVTNHGSAVAYPIVHITGGSSAGRLHQIRSYTTNRILSFDLDIAIAEEIDIIAREDSIQIVSWVRGDITRYLLPGSSISLDLLPNENSVTVFTTGGAPTVTMRWEKRYSDAAALAYGAG